MSPCTSPFSEAAGDAAALRKAFNRAVETYPRPVAAFLSEAGEAAFRAWWGELYRAVRDTTAGLELLSRLAALEAENRRLWEEIATLGRGPV